ncbi:Holliday junction resolvase RecU [Fructilactobacillus myrtifloralis]|uniref:Holliday junction resolvase RecU n=1 Tax=Fructilactobacillus myrtifloralis TaxID=2940301 RepID=A0ABY5BPB4_9LACO|nr:Holliday junction resolvase RecU [Fructilactobacillus myrtifloralis]USS85324.1 Holliday junction resolvase RecU [Fructilactobacillus myrtifloralis]
MTINYPNGRPFQTFTANHRAQPHSTTVHGDRGMSLEAEINQSNQFYQAQQIAVVHKKPTPIQIVNVDYPKRSAAVIKEAYFKQASTTDYNGIYAGYYLDFDAKETTNLHSFPLANFHPHQIQHMQSCADLGGICFALIRFVRKNEIYLLNGPDLFRFWERQFNGGRKSITRTELATTAYLIKPKINPLIPYLDAVQAIIDKNKGE